MDFMDLVEVPSWVSFRLRIDVKAEICATGWMRVGGRWVMMREETDEALRGVMFTRVESRTGGERGVRHVCNPGS